tara:strand:- start:4023 stop:4214 length:192 start_codon:yes stop_codon:yes gene_type:complete
MKLEDYQSTSRFIIYEENDGTYSVVIRVNPFISKDQAKAFVDILASENGYEAEDILETKRTIN